MSKCVAAHDIKDDGPSRDRICLEENVYHCICLLGKCVKHKFICVPKNIGEWQFYSQQETSKMERFRSQIWMNFHKKR